MEQGQRPLREQFDLLAEGWSDWTLVMRRRQGGDTNYVRRDGHEGFYRRTWSDDDEIVDDVQQCGVYEFKLVKGNQHNCVYVGCTCRCRGDGSLRARINEYLHNGSHKAGKINDALRRDAEIHVRVKPCTRPNGGDMNDWRKRAERMENDLLRQYDYAWNQRKNGEMRRI